jgi:hypothetical protein
MLPSHDPLPEKLLALEFFGTVSSWLDNQFSVQLVRKTVPCQHTEASL